MEIDKGVKTLNGCHVFPFQWFWPFAFDYTKISVDLGKPFSDDRGGNQKYFFCAFEF